jgi:large subunit ribosomal protein L3
MASAMVKDNTPDSMTKGKKIYMPVTILEAPHMKVFSLRFYNHGKVTKEVIVSHDKELKKVVRIPKTLKPLEQHMPKEYDDIKVIAYSLPKETSVKKSPDLIELALQAENKLEYAKSLIGKEISLKDFLHYELLDVRGLTKGKGLVGPVKRFGLALKQHKTEKGVRRPGSLAPWHPARVTFRTPQAGQLGMFSRIHYNIKALFSSSILEKDINPSHGFKHYGKIRSSYLILSGSVQGPVKRQVLITPSFRPTKFQAKKKYEFQEIIV